MEHTFRTVVLLVLVACASASCDKLKPPLKPPFPQTNPAPPSEQVPSPKEQAPGASGVGGVPSRQSLQQGAGAEGPSAPRPRRS